MTAIATVPLPPPIPSSSHRETVADLLDDLGGIGPERVLLMPLPGTATEADLVFVNDRKERLVELIDGVLVEKPMGQLQSRLAIWLAIEIGIYLRQHPLGRLIGADGPFRVSGGRVRLPDLAFVSFEQIPREPSNRDPVGSWVPELAVEVLSASNTRQEMERKLQEYFDAGVRRVWMADPEQRTVRVYRSVDEFQELTDGDELSDEAILPGFHCSVSQWFDCP